MHQSYEPKSYESVALSALSYGGIKPTSVHVVVKQHILLLQHCSSDFGGLPFMSAHHLLIFILNSGIYM